MSAVYFTDRDLGRQFPAVLREAGIAVLEHGDHFEPAVSDEEWLTAVAKHRWIAVTHDRRIRYKPNEQTRSCGQRWAYWS